MWLNSIGLHLLPILFITDDDAGVAGLAYIVVVIFINSVFLLLWPIFAFSFYFGLRWVQRTLSDRAVSIICSLLVLLSISTAVFLVVDHPSHKARYESAQKKREDKLIKDLYTIDFDVYAPSKLPEGYLHASDSVDRGSPSVAPKIFRSIFAYKGNTSKNDPNHPTIRLAQYADTNTYNPPTSCGPLDQGDLLAPCTEVGKNQEGQGVYITKTDPSKRIFLYTRLKNTVIMAIYLNETEMQLNLDLLKSMKQFQPNIKYLNSIE